MFYEGTEKRLEIIVKQDNLLQFPEQFWQEMVAQAGAFILSKIENKNICAYLLSESSLFIWENRLLLITCGNTHLVKAAQFFQKKIPNEQVQSLLFHRHQAIQPNLQKSDFVQDSRLLDKYLQGRTFHWQGPYQGDLYFFGLLNEERLNNKQILMLHGLSGAFAKRLQAGEASSQQIESKLAYSDYFPNLLIDHFAFSPKGYSLNAIADNHYLTIHITPEKLSTYLSLESSFESGLLTPFITHLIKLFSPSQSHLMRFTKDNNQGLSISLQKP